VFRTRTRLAPISGPSSSGIKIEAVFLSDIFSLRLVGNETRLDFVHRERDNLKDRVTGNVKKRARYVK